MKKLCVCLTVLVIGVMTPGIVYGSLTGSKQDPFAEEKKRLEECCQRAKEADSEITGEEAGSIPDARFCVTNQIENNLRIQTIISQIDKNQVGEFYIIGKNFIPNGIAASVWLGNGGEYSIAVADTFIIETDYYTVSKMSVSWKEAGGGINPQPEKRHWNTGDVVERELDGKTYQFECIDQNYRCKEDRQKHAALFLCTSVIPADSGSAYRYEQQEDGSWSYVFYAGPIVNFGAGNDYKYSNIRKWLRGMKTEACGEEVPVGVEYAFSGQTGNRQFGQMNASDLKAGYIGYQSMTEHFFILSVDEALNYKESLWRFECAGEDNPDTQYGPFSKGYWLRSPVGTGDDYDTDQVYVVDLVNGNIRPWPVRPEENGDDVELNMTSTIGTRPAFVMPQQP